jgi:hypothetical protein
MNSRYPISKKIYKGRRPKWIVSWAERDNPKGLSRQPIIGLVCKNYMGEFGVQIRMFNGDYNLLWINELATDFNRYTQWVEDTYDMTAMIFDNEESAQKAQAVLEQLLMVKILTA